MEKSRVTEVYRVSLGGPLETTDDIVKRIKEKGLGVHGWIMQKNFPLDPRTTIENVEIEIIDLDHPYSRNEGPEFLKANGLKCPTFEHALRFSEQCGMMMGKKPYIVFFHEPFLSFDGYHCIMLLDRHSAFWHRLDLDLYPNIQFGRSCALAGVRPCE